MQRPADLALRRFGEAAKWATEYELRVRLLADKADGTRPKALATKLEDVEDAVLTHFASLVTEPDRSSIKAARQIRNKLLHCEFWKAEDRITAHSGAPKRAGMSLVKLSQGNLAQSLMTGPRIPLRELDETQPRLFGRVLEGAAPGGLFQRAEEIFVEAIVVIERLTNTF